jgi:hypothetical protein
MTMSRRGIGDTVAVIAERRCGRSGRSLCARKPSTWRRCAAVAVPHARITSALENVAGVPVHMVFIGPAPAVASRISRGAGGVRRRRRRIAPVCYWFSRRVA